MALCLMACSHESLDNTVGRTSLQVTAGVATKASDAVWNGDNIGITAVSTDPATSTGGMTSAYRNAKYSTTSTSTVALFTPATEDQTIYFDDYSTKVSFTAYGPYQESAIDELPGDEGVISGSTAVQVTAENTETVDPAQEAIDYIFASEATATGMRPTVGFNFSHSMAKIVVKIVAGTDIDEADIRDTGSSVFTLSGLVHSGTFDVTTGVAAADGDATATEDWDLAGSCPSETVDGGIAFIAIIYPQNPAAITLSAEIGGSKYSGVTLPVPSADDGGTDGFAAGNSYTYTLTVSKQSVNIGQNGSEIVNWKEGPGFEEGI